MDKIFKLKFSQILILLSLFSVSNVFATASPTNCFFNVSKINGWENYTVTINVVDFTTNFMIATIKLPAATTKQNSVNQLSVPFDCTKYQQLAFSASFSPSIWANQANKVYSSKKILDISSQVTSIPVNGKLVLSVIFPTDFSNVPELL